MEQPQKIEVGSKKIARIGTDNFIDYLTDKKETDKGLLRGDIDDFEKQIEMPEEIHNAIKEMYEEKRGSKPPLNVEQARVIYFDRGKRNIRSTSSTYGSDTWVDMGEPIQEVVSKNGFPIIGIHTHLEDINLSFNDYLLMLSKKPEEEIKMFKAEMVLLQSMQIMAVATDNTPLFINGNGLYEFVRSHVSELNKKRLELTSVPDEEAKTINSALINFSRELNVKLYFSQDMRTFKEFSA
jgi:hypothetical protein